MLRHLLAIAIIGILTGYTDFSKAEGDNNFRQRIHQQKQQIYGEQDIRAEIRLGREISARIFGRYARLQDPQLTRYVTLVGKSLTLNSSRTEIDYHFAVLDTPQVNAYSAPGGYVFVTKGALEQMHDEAELAAVLAHEIAHVTQRHIVKELGIRSDDTSETGFIGQLLSGSGGSANVAFTQVVDKATSILFKTGYHQQDELEADRVGTLMLATTGYDPLSLQRYLTRIHMRKDQLSESINTTHPSSQKRVDKLARLIHDEKLDKGEYSVAQARFADHVIFN